MCCSCVCLPACLLVTLCICLSPLALSYVAEEGGYLGWWGSSADPAATVIQSWLCNPLELQKRDPTAPGDSQVSSLPVLTSIIDFQYTIHWMVDHLRYDRRFMFLFLEICSRDEDEVQKVYEAELSFLESCLKVNPKSYGSWHHRGWVSAHLPRPDWARELSLCDRCLTLDDRNCE